MAHKNTCGRPTKGGTPCKNPRSWIDTGCVAHLTDTERAAREIREERLAREMPWLFGKGAESFSHDEVEPGSHLWPVPSEPVRGWGEFVDWHRERCAICLRMETLVEDHCHRTGLTRGLLCYRCNTREGTSALPLFDLYRTRPPAVILQYATRYSYREGPAQPEPWVSRALGPVPRSPMDAAKYLAAAALLPRPRAGWGRGNVLNGTGI